jgi:hypothetical protein
MNAADWLTSDAVTEALAKIKAENDNQASDYLIYECAEHGDYRVPVELIGGEWVVEAGEKERCPVCGRFGRDLESEDPDAYWQANERAEER